MKSARLVSLLEKYKEGILPIDTTTIELIKEINELYKQVEVLQMQVNGLRADRKELCSSSSEAAQWATGRYSKDNMPV